MRRLIYLMILITIFNLCGCTISFNKQEALKTKKEIKSETINAEQVGNVKTDSFQVDKESIMNNIKILCKSPRMRGTQEEKDACKFINSELLKDGYSTIVQKVPLYKQDNKSRMNYGIKFENYFKLNPYNSNALGYAQNLIAEKKDDKETNRTLILSAHYDTNKNSIGAVDNASGVAVLLEIAKQLKNINTPFNIKYIFFSAEELSCYGSRYYVSKLTNEEKMNIIGCINIDMVGEKNKKLEITTPQGVNTVINFVIEETNKDMTFPVSFKGASDHLPFSIAKIPAITFIQDSSDVSIMSKKSQLEYLDSKELKKTAEILLKVITTYNLKLHDQFVLENKSKSISEDSIAIKVNDMKVTQAALNEFKLKDISSKLFYNGVSSITILTFENNQGNKYFITQIPFRFAPNVDLTNYKKIKSSYCSLYTGIDTYSPVKLIIESENYVTQISGDISQQEAINLYEKYKY